MSESKFDEVQAAIAAKLAPAVDVRAPYAKVMIAEAARAAIEVLREPTEAMKAACEGSYLYQLDPLHVVAYLYPRMIDEALK